MILHITIFKWSFIILYAEYSRCAGTFSSLSLSTSKATALSTSFIVFLCSLACSRWTYLRIYTVWFNLNHWIRIAWCNLPIKIFELLPFPLLLFRHPLTITHTLYKCHMHLPLVPVTWYVDGIFFVLYPRCKRCNFVLFKY